MNLKHIKKNQRNSGSETMKYLREKTEMEIKIRKKKLDQKIEENEAAKNQAVLLQQQQQTMLQSMPQQQQQVFTMMMQAQQQQQTTLLSLVEKLANKKETFRLWFWFGHLYTNCVFFCFFIT